MCLLCTLRQQTMPTSEQKKVNKGCNFYLKRNDIKKRSKSKLLSMLGNCVSISVFNRPKIKLITELQNRYFSHDYY